MFNKINQCYYEKQAALLVCISLQIGHRILYLNAFYNTDDVVI